MKGSRMLTSIALSAVLIAVSSWISIPSTPPFTMQTFAVFCVMGVLGGKLGTAAVIVYLMLGAAGVPVFSGFSGGLGAIFGATGGYMVGFIFIGLIYWLATALFGEKTWVRAGALLLGLAVCYFFGTLWFMAVYARQSGAIGIGTALSLCVLPFVIPDIAKLALALVLARRVRAALGFGKNFQKKSPPFGE